MKIGDTANGDDFTEGTSRERRILIIIIINRSSNINDRVKLLDEGQ